MLVVHIQVMTIEYCKILRTDSLITHQLITKFDKKASVPSMMQMRFN